MENEIDPTEPKQINRRKTILKYIVGLLLVWLMVAYILAPEGWKEFARHDPTFDDSPRITETSDHHPGDPLNVAFIGTESQLIQAMEIAGWYSAAALGLRSDLRIAEDTVLSRPDDAAPVSNLFLFGRKEDLAFEQPVGDNPRHRHHVRLWKTDKLNSDGRPRWVGSAVYDERVGLSHTTGQITHVTAPNIDAERDYLLECLESAGDLSRHFIVKGFHTKLKGRNGGGDPWYTDGDLYVGVIKETIN